MFRLVRGNDCYWAVGQRRVARVPLSGVTPDGRLTEAHACHLADADLSPPVDPGLYHLTVVITTRCNLACSYCFQNVAPVGEHGASEHGASEHGASQHGASQHGARVPPASRLRFSPRTPRRPSWSRPGSG